MDRKLLERVIKRLEEKELIDREYMDADDRGALEYEIVEMRKLLPKVTTELVGCYCNTEDKTFVMKYTYVGSELYKGECVGWYCGEPNDEDNKRYSNGDLIAIYDFDN